MFITVKYGAEEEKIFNPNCLSAVLLNHIKHTCGFENEILDLASETGEVMDLAKYAKKFLESRSSYILVKIIGDETEESSPTYIPLLDNALDKIKFSVTNPTFKQRAKAKGDKREPVKDKDKPDESVQQKKTTGNNKLPAQENVQPNVAGDKKGAPVATNKKPAK
ncbi:hypothetical protein BC833DRAFT_620582 [Globomyces pollinis-pini]|nr:hypothetical protein BC833DRAFT_620582 [Globomyces pollinis-pini]